MTSIIIILLFAGALGAGSAAIQLSGIRERFSLFEDFTLSLALGAGLLGWFAFFPGITGFYTASVLATMTLISAIGIYPLWSRWKQSSGIRIELHLSKIDVLLLILLFLIALLDFAEALSPQADADTMAYHFATPKLFLEKQEITFIPRALDGGVPLLQQLSYGIALALGGEQAANVWLAITGWVLGLVTYTITHHFTSRTWALACTLLVMTTPAIIYGAGTGQVEARTATYVIIAAFTVFLALKENLLGFTWIAAISVGLFFGTKYTGLLLGFCCGLVLLSHGPRYFRHTLFFTIATILIGCQWYLFNFSQTGDPLFPLLWGYVEYPAGFPWSDVHSESLKTIYSSRELPLAKSFASFFLYPFIATLDPYPQFEALRIGLGVAWLVLLPTAIAGAFLEWKDASKKPYVIFLSICLIYYSVWFILGTSQRVRHLLPIYPLLLIVLFCLAASASAYWRQLIAPCVLAILLVAAFQVSASGLFAKKFVHYLASGQTQDDFLKRNLVGYDAVLSVNRLLDQQDKVLVVYRNWIYRLEVPYFYAHPDLQNQVSLLPGQNSPAHFLQQTRSLGITHVVATPPNKDRPENNPPLQHYLLDLELNACVDVLRQIDAPSWPSRTLQLKPPRIQKFLIYKMTPETCRIH